MDESDYKFLNLTDLDEHDKNEINSILKSRVDSDCLKLPWDVGKNDIEYNIKPEEEMELPANPLPYETPVEQINNGIDMSVMWSPMDPNPHFFIPPQPPHYVFCQAATQEMYPAYIHMIADNRRGRGRGNKRGGGSGNFSNRNYNHNHNHNVGHNEIHSGFIQPVEPNQCMPLPSMCPLGDMNSAQQQMIGPPLVTLSQYPLQIHDQPMLSNTFRPQFYQSHKAVRSFNPAIPPSNGEGMYPMNSFRNVPPKDRPFIHQNNYRGQNNRRTNFRQTEEDSAASNVPHTNIVTTTTTKVTVNDNQVEKTDTSKSKEAAQPKPVTSHGQNLPVNVKIEHIVMASVNSNKSENNFTKESKVELSMVNIDSNIEVKQSGDEKEVKVSQSSSVGKSQPTELESVKTKEVMPAEEKLEKPLPVVEQTNVVDTVAESKSPAKAQTQELPVSEAISTQSAPPPPPPVTTTVVSPAPTVISFASAVKQSKPTATILPINSVAVTANNQSPKSREVEEERPRVSATNSFKNSNTTTSVAPVINNEKPKCQSASKIEPSPSENNTNHNVNTIVNSAKAEDYYNDPLTYRMGEFLLGYQMNKQTVSLIPRGLTNRSNYCYINSILQALLACPPFYNLLMAMPYTKNTSKKSSLSPLLDNMIRFVREFTPLSDDARLVNRKDRRNETQKRNENASVDIQSDVPFEPVYVYTMLKNTSSMFSVEGRQEDAEEFLSCLLNGISDEMLALMKIASGDKESMKHEDNVNSNQGDDDWKQVTGPKNKGSITRCTEFGRTPLSDIFRGQLRSRVTRAGEQCTDYVQPFFTLQLDIEKAENVTEAFEILVGKDQVEGMTCSKTKQQIEVWKQVFLEELPIILILHLKWFDYKLDGCSKILKQVDFPVNLKVDTKFLSAKAGKQYHAKQKQYKLFAVTYHDGKEATKGHYLTDAFHVGYGGWVRYDDNSLKGMPESSVLKPQPPRVPYLLYYRRLDTIGNNNNNNNNNNANNNNQAKNNRSR